MAVLTTLRNAKISVYGGWREHPPPHCHLKGPDTNCTIDLATHEVMKGHYAKTDLAEALVWLAANAAAALTTWRRLNERE